MAFFKVRKNDSFAEILFKAVMAWRIAYGALRIYIGYRLLGLIGLPVAQAYQRFFRRDAFENHDSVLNFINHALSHHGYAITYFLASYFFFWGFVDIALSAAMIRHKLWAFSVTTYCIIAFIAYEAYRFTHTHSYLLLAVIFIDIFLIYLIRHEKQKIIARRERKLEKARNDDRKPG